MRFFGFLPVLLVAVTATATPADWWVMRYLSSGVHAVVAHPADPNVLYLTWDTTVSFDSGQTWEWLGSGVRGAREFSPDPFDPFTVYLITWGDPEDPSKQLVRITWRDGPHPEILGDLSTFEGGIPSSVLVHPLQPQILYVGTAKGDLFRSEDRGGTWHRLYRTDPEASPQSYGIYMMVVPPAAPSTIYINDPVDNTALYRSFDEGQTWQRLVPDPEHRYVVTLVAAVQKPEVLYLSVAGCRSQAVYGCSEGAVYRSQDRGDSWEHVLQRNWPRLILPGGDLSTATLAVDPEDPARVVATSNEGVYLTEDGGETWSFLELPISGLRGEYTAYSVAIQPTHPKRLLATTVDVLFALELPAGSTSVSPSSWGRIKARFVPVLPGTPE